MWLLGLSVYFFEIFKGVFVLGISISFGGRFNRVGCGFCFLD